VAPQDSKIAVEILQSVNNRTQRLREIAYYAWLLLTYIVINTLLDRLTLGPAVCIVLDGTMLLFLVTIWVQHVVYSRIDFSEPHLQGNTII